MKRFAALICTLLLAATAASAQEAPSGFSAQGSATAQALFGGMTINLGADIGLFSRGQQLRLDISHLSIPTSNATATALLQQFLPQNAFTVVIDRAAKTTTLWSAEKRLYYVKPMSSATPASGGTSTGAAPAPMIMQMLKSFKDYSIYEASARLVGRGTANGHPVTVLRYDVRTQKRGGPLSTLSGDVDLADDEGGLPVRVTSALQGRNIKGSFRLDFRMISATAPDPSSFAVPAGYAQTNDPAQILSMPASSSRSPARH